MDFTRLLEIVGDEQVFDTGLLLAGDVDPNHVRRQLSRWTKAGRIIQLRRGLYSLAAPYQKVKAHPFSVANRMVHGSYVSCQSALAYFGLIPEYVPATISVSSSRPNRWNTAMGTFIFRHIKLELVFGYSFEDLGDGNRAFVAKPEKALLDLIHLTPRADDEAFLEGLRLQNFDRVDLNVLKNLAAQSSRPKLMRAAELVSRIAQSEKIR